MSRPGTTTRRLILLLMVTLVGLGTALAPPATAGAAQRPEIRNFNVRGQFVYGYRWVPVADPCFQDTFITVDAGTAEGGWVYYTEFSANLCTGEATSLTGRAVPDIFKFSGNLASARVVADIPLTNEMTGLPAGSLHLDNVWTATGPPKRYTEKERFSIPGDWLYRFTVRGTLRKAIATGTVPLDDSVRIGRASVLHLDITHP